MRHGEAQPQHSSDRERQLTDTGTSEVQHMAQWLRTNYSAFDCIYASPYRRTLQTASLLTDCGVSAGPVRIHTDLTPHGNPALVVDYIDMVLRESPQKRLVLVSHMPLVSFLVEAFTQPGFAPVFDTSAVVCLDYQPLRTPMAGKFVSYTTPNSRVSSR